MECNIITTGLQPCFARINIKGIDKFQVNMAGWNGKGQNKQNRVLIGKSPVHYERWRVFCSPTSLEEGFSAKQSTNFSADEESDSGNSQEEAARPPSSEELKALLSDSERSKLIKKLSEANQQNRYLKRQLQVKEDALVNFKSELAVIELEIQVHHRLWLVWQKILLITVFQKVQERLMENTFSLTFFLVYKLSKKSWRNRSRMLILRNQKRFLYFGMV